MSGFGINDNSNNKKIFGDFTNNPLKNGGLRRENVAAKFQSIFDKVDTHKDGILDQTEMKNFMSAVAGNDNIIDKKEAKGFLAGNDGNKLTFQDGDKTKNLTPEDLRDFLQQAQTSVTENDIKSAIQSTVDGNAAVTLTKNDDSQEIIFDNKDLDVNRKTVTQNENGETVTTEYKDSVPVKQTTVDKNNGNTEIIKYENGQPVSKDVTSGINEQHYSFDANGNPVLETEVENKGIPAKEKTSTHTYDGNTETIDITTPDGKKQTLVKVNGKLQSETNTETGRQETITYGADGKPTSRAILKGNDFSKPDTKETITYNQDGSRKEVFEQSNKDITITNNYNANGFKTKETAVVDGKTYTANYDGKGHGTLTLKAGESIQAFAKRVGCSEAEIKQLNKFPGGIPQAGQQIRVPDKYVKATDFNNYSVDAKTERAKGNAAEKQRVDQNLNKLSETFEQKGTKGKYASYDDYASRLIQNEIKQGSLPSSAVNDKNLHKALSAKIQQLNGNKDIKTLDSIKCPVSATYKKSLDAQVARANNSANAQKQAAIQKNWKDGDKIAGEIHDAVYRLGTDMDKLNNAFSKINKDNVSSLILNYDRYAKNAILDNDKGVFEALYDEGGSIPKYYSDKILSNLTTKAKELHIDVSSFNTNVAAAIKKGDKMKLDKLTQAMATNINMREGMSSQELKALSSSSGANRDNASATFRETLNKALKSLNTQRGFDGWAGDLADILGHAYGSKNTESAVKKDILTLSKQQKELDALKNNPTAFANKFEEIFGTKYDPVTIKSYGKIQAKWAAVDSAKTAVDVFANNNDTLLNYKGGKVSAGNFRTVDDRINTLTATLARGFSVKSIPKEKLGANMTESIKNLTGLKWSSATPEQKMSALSKLANKYKEALDTNLKSQLGGRSYESYQTQYNRAYNQAFGTKNDIMERVENYNHSQEVGAGFITTIAKAATMCTGVGAGIASIAVEGSDTMTSKTRRKNFDAEAALDLVHTAAVESTVGKLGKATGEYTKEIKSTVGRYTANATSDITVGAAADYAKTGEVSMDGTLENAILSAVARYGVAKLNDKLKIPPDAEPDTRVTITIKGKTFTPTVQQIKNLENQALKPAKKALGIEADNMIDTEV